MRKLLRLLPLAALGFAAASCSSGAPEDAVNGQEQHWDSAGGNPTHATHSYMAEFAVKTLADELPEVATYKDAILRGVNLELHDLPITKDEAMEALRVEIGGNNWAAEHPEILWSRARESYAAGDKDTAYFYVGIILHYVQDMGVPAHAFHVIHQSSASNWDHIELLGFFQFHADFSVAPPPDPGLDNPVDYLAWSAGTARDQFNAAFPGATYTRTFFPQAYDQMTDVHWKFLRGREAQCSWGTAYALRSAALGLAALASP
jgi:hypothetical protein